ncbi:MAG: hypothetical protein ACE5IL_00925 [Myxococcota bacterium]
MAVCWGLGCVSLQRIQIRYEPLVPNAATRVVAPVSIQLWDRTPARPLRRIGRIEAQARRPRGDLERALRRRAAAEGGQAIIDLQQSERPDARLPSVVAFWVSDLPPLRRIRGTVVVFTDPAPGVHDAVDVDAGGAP